MINIPEYNVIRDKEHLKELQALPLEHKVDITKALVRDWYEYWDGKVYCSYSGGKDLSVLVDIIRETYPDIEAVFVNTTVEYPEIYDRVRATDNVRWLEPELDFEDVVKKHGWCYPSKDVAGTIYYARRGSDWAIKRLNGVNKDGTYSWFRQRYKKWLPLFESDIPISDLCCNELKMKPLNRYRRETGKRDFVATMASESTRREQSVLKSGCNNYGAKVPVSRPMAIWTEQDVLSYIKATGLPIAGVYGDIVEKKGKLETTGEKRTGCFACPVGCHLDKTNRFQRMAITHPEQYDYCINRLGLGAVLDFVGVNYFFKEVSKCEMSR